MINIFDWRAGGGGGVDSDNYHKLSQIILVENGGTPICHIF